MMAVQFWTVWCSLGWLGSLGVVGRDTSADRFHSSKTRILSVMEGIPPTRDVDSDGAPARSVGSGGFRSMFFSCFGGRFSRGWLVSWRPK